MTVLTSERLVIRPARLDDAAALHPGYVDEVAMRYWSHPPHATLAETEAKLARNLSLAAEGWRMWAITLAGDDAAIGTMNAHGARNGVAEIGYSLLREHWGRGLAREAVAALLDQLFRVEGVRRVKADTDPDNTGSIRVLEALGFACEARLRAEWETHIGIRDSLIWGLLAAEWRSADAPRQGSTGTALSS